MSGYQVVVTDNDGRCWDSIRDTARRALYKVSEYMLSDIDDETQDAGHMIQSGLIFGKDACEIEISALGYKIEIKQIP